MEWTPATIGLLAAFIIALALAIGFILFHFLDQPSDPSADLPARVKNVQFLIYTGTNQGEDIFYAINRERNTLETFAAGFQLLSEPTDTSKNTMTVTFDYGSGVTVPTEFRVGANVNEASVVINVGLPEARTIALSIVSMATLSSVLRKAAQLV